MKEIFYEVVTLALLAVVVGGIVILATHFLPQFIETIDQYLSGRTPKY